MFTGAQWAHWGSNGLACRIKRHIFLFEEKIREKISATCLLNAEHTFILQPVSVSSEMFVASDKNM